MKNHAKYSCVTPFSFYNLTIRELSPTGYERLSVAEVRGGILKKCVNGQAVYPLSEQDGLKAQERRYTAYGKEKH